MNNKKAQAEVITVVLIILLVLAAIIIVWQVIRGTVGETSTELETRSDCIGADLEISNLSTNRVDVRRNAGGPAGDINVKVIVAGVPQATAIIGLSELESGNLALTATLGQEVEIAAIIGTVQCGVIDSAIIP